MPDIDAAIRPAFLINDPDHAPFGLLWLKGITPARFALIAAICAAGAIPPLANVLAAPELRMGYIAELWVEHALLALISSLPMFLIVVTVERASQESATGRRILAILAAVVAGAAVFGLLYWAYFTMRQGAYGANLGLLGFSYFSRALIFGGLMTGVLFFAARQRLAARESHRAHMEELGNERQIAQARLQLLHSQIEPHFLFNSFASVKLLYETDPDKGRTLLRNMSEYLAAAIPAWRRQETRLDAELMHLEAYLAIFRTRMGDRLRTRIEVPQELLDSAVPPLMLGTLIENALKHGIGPRASGGTLTVSACREGAGMRLSVADDGVGFKTESGTGVGLANTRDRLQSLYGDAASLDLARNLQGGVTASLWLPYRLAAEA
jgi:hypothetical protein